VTDQITDAEDAILAAHPSNPTEALAVAVLLRADLEANRYTRTSEGLAGLSGLIDVLAAIAGTDAVGIGLRRYAVPGGCAGRPGGSNFGVRFPA